MPILHKPRYFAWARQTILSPARACLRSAMRTIAAAVSVQSQELHAALYAETRDMLEALDVSEQSQIQLEQIQAWLLLAHYELLRMHEHKAMLTAGVAFRMVQLLKLYSIDAPDMSRPQPDAMNPSASVLTDENFAEIEEKRRTYWLAFSFDRFLSERNEWPLTLHEEVICVRLPAPEMNFQNSQPICMEFLYEAMANSGRTTLPIYAECMVLAALYGRCMTHRRLALATAFPSKEPSDFWIRHEWLAVTLEKRIQLLLHSSPAATTMFECDTLSMYTHMLAHSAVVHLSQTIGKRTWRTVEYQMAAISYEQRAHQAAIEMTNLAREMPRYFCFKVHPFLPSTLSCAVIFLMTHTKIMNITNPNKIPEDGVEQLLETLKHLKDINNLARELLARIEVGDANATSRIHASC
ncbi:MAG: hypothetical protein Q9227_008117 [Pyrenula ochraceoflavens]